MARAGYASERIAGDRLSVGPLAAQAEGGFVDADAQPADAAVGEREQAGAGVRDFAGAFRSGDTLSPANDCIDADLTRDFGDSLGETK